MPAFDRQQLSLQRRAAMRGKAAEPAAGGEHAMARNEDREGIAAERPADRLRRLRLADAAGDLAIAGRGAGPDGARFGIDAALEGAELRQVKPHVGAIRPAAVDQRDDAVHDSRDRRGWFRFRARLQRRTSRAWVAARSASGSCTVTMVSSRHATPNGPSAVSKTVKPQSHIRIGDRTGSSLDTTSVWEH